MNLEEAVGIWSNCSGTPEQVREASAFLMDADAIFRIRANGYDEEMADVIHVGQKNAVVRQPYRDWYGNPIVRLMSFPFAVGGYSSCGMTFALPPDAPCGILHCGPCEGFRTHAVFTRPEGAAGRGGAGKRPEGIDGRSLALFGAAGETIRFAEESAA